MVYWCIGVLGKIATLPITVFIVAIGSNFPFLNHYFVKVKRVPTIEILE